MKKQSLLLSLLFVSLFPTLSCQHSQVQYNCIAQIMAWDFGSGTIKVKAAEVDTCDKKIVKELYQNSFPISFKQDLDQSKDKTFSQTTVTAAHDFIKSVRQETQNLRIQKHVGVATAAFREAHNATSVLDIWNRDYSLNIKIISQDDEARLGVKSAMTLIKPPSSSPVSIIWDIGGGSQQISVVDTNNLESPTTYKSLWAAVSFKNWVIKNIKKKKDMASPNPLSAKEFSQAVRQAKTFAADFKMTPSSTLVPVYGIGGVHSSSIKKRLKKNSYTQEDLIELSSKNLNKRDAEIGGQYAATEVTNLALVLGTMQGLGFTSVTPLDAGLLEGLLAYEHAF